MPTARSSRASCATPRGVTSPPCCEDCSRFGHWSPIRFCLGWKPPSMPLSRNVASSAPISPHTGTCISHGRGEDCRRISSLTNSTVVTTSRATISCRFLCFSRLETGLEIECCKELTVDCLQNASNGTVEITYLKRRARGAEHKRLRVRDGGPDDAGRPDPPADRGHRSSAQAPSEPMPLGLLRRRRVRRRHWPPAGDSSIRGRGDTTSSMMMGVRSGSSCPACARPTRRFGT